MSNHITEEDSFSLSLCILIVFIISFSSGYSIGFNYGRIDTINGELMEKLIENEHQLKMIKRENERLLVENSKIIVNDK